MAELVRCIVRETCPHLNKANCVGLQFLQKYIDCKKNAKKYKKTKKKQKHNNSNTNTEIKRKEITTKTTDILVNEATWAFKCFVYTTNKITGPFEFIKITFTFIKVKMLGFE